MIKHLSCSLGLSATDNGCPASLTIMSPTALGWLLRVWLGDPICTCTNAAAGGWPGPNLVCRNISMNSSLSKENFWLCICAIKGIHSNSFWFWSRPHDGHKTQGVTCIFYLYFNLCCRISKYWRVSNSSFKGISAGTYWDCEWEREKERGCQAQRGMSLCYSLQIDLVPIIELVFRPLKALTALIISRPQADSGRQWYKLSFPTTFCSFSYAVFNRESLLHVVALCAHTHISTTCIHANHNIAMAE